MKILNNSSTSFNGGIKFPSSTHPKVINNFSKLFSKDATKVVNSHSTNFNFLNIYAESKAIKFLEETYKNDISYLHLKNNNLTSDQFWNFCRFDMNGKFSNLG